jgi:DNA polymerase-3 subunit gamma/tau
VLSAAEPEVDVTLEPLPVAPKGTSAAPRITPTKANSGASRSAKPTPKPAPEPSPAPAPTPATGPPKPEAGPVKPQDTIDPFAPR